MEGSKRPKKVYSALQFVHTRLVCLLQAYSAEESIVKVIEHLLDVAIVSCTFLSVMFHVTAYFACVRITVHTLLHVLS